jgi:alkanesulfonate monooxygenase SsuD/methylene tetrahydromethanopterin reductase-like flavin-dependent oxidoreductase (luciferase family)
LESAARAGRLGVGLAIAMLGGNPLRYLPLVEAYREAGVQAGHGVEQLKIGITGHGYIARTTQQAKDEYFPYYLNYWSHVNRQRGMAFQMDRTDFEHMASPETALLVGSPQQIVEKIMRQYELFGHKRFLAQIDIGGLPFHKVVDGIELLATEVAPIVRRETSK